MSWQTYHEALTALLRVARIVEDSSARLRQLRDDRLRQLDHQDAQAVAQVEALTQLLEAIYQQLAGHAWPGNLPMPCHGCLIAHPLAILPNSLSGAARSPDGASET